MSETPNVVMNEAAHRFEIALEGETAFAEYRLHPERGEIVLPHTVVPEAFGGRGFAGALATFAFGYARDHGLKVIPTCPFMAGWVKKHPEAQDLVADRCRPELGI
jgi:predicted GNAT family acetyltransferase